MSKEPKSGSEASSDQRSYFRVPLEFQIRFRKISQDEFKVFESFALRPSPYSSFRNEIHTSLQMLDIRDESKSLLERAFQLLMNIDQRLERLEETVQGLADGKEQMAESYEWVHGDLGAGGMAFDWEKAGDFATHDMVLLDIILPSLPEHRFVAAGKIIDKRNKTMGFEFKAIHEDDREYIHSFVRNREREILRARAREKSDKV